MYDNYECVQTLIKAGSDIHMADKSDKTVLHYATKNKNIAIVKLLLDMGACPDVIDCDSNTPLMAAIANDCPEIVKHLIVARCNVNFIGKTIAAGVYRWCTPLERALLGNNWVISKMLVLAGSGLACMRMWANEGQIPDQVLQDPELLNWVMSTLEAPRPLMEICRLHLRDTMPYDQREKIDKLPIPASIKAFLAYKDLERVINKEI